MAWEQKVNQVCVKPIKTDRRVKLELNENRELMQIILRPVVNHLKLV